MFSSFALVVAIAAAFAAEMVLHEGLMLDVLALVGVVDMSKSDQVFLK